MALTNQIFVLSFYSDLAYQARQEGRDVVHVGSTRYVVCVGNYAVKIARIKCLHWTKKVIQWIRSDGGVTQKVMCTPGEKKWSALKHLFAGVTANLEEARFWQSHQHLPLAPTTFSFLGLVNIQHRGTVINRSQLHMCPFREYAHLCEAQVDLNRPENFGLVGGRAVLIDYGYDVVNQVIS